MYLIRPMQAPAGTTGIFRFGPGIWNPGYNLRGFPIGSKLHEYLAKHERDLIKPDIKIYRFTAILLALKSVITRKELFDPQNPFIIVCDEELREALDVKALHKSQMIEILEKILKPATGVALLTSPLICLQEIDTINFWMGIDPSTFGSTEPFDIESDYLVDPTLIKVFKTIPGQSKIRRILAYREICRLISTYVLTNKEKFIDLKNIRVLNLTNDPLGEAFRVGYLERRQVTKKIRDLLTPIKRSPRTKARKLKGLILSYQGKDSLTIHTLRKPGVF